MKALEGDWVNYETELARKHNLNLLPIVIGTWNVSGRLHVMTSGFHQIRVNRADDLITDAKFNTLISRWLDPSIVPDKLPPKDTVEGWYATPGRSVSDQALALCVATLPGASTETVFSMAAAFEQALEKSRRRLTRERLAQQPRDIGVVSRLSRLEAIRAHRAVTEATAITPRREKETAYSLSL